MFRFREVVSHEGDSGNIHQSEISWKHILQNYIL